MSIKKRDTMLSASGSGVNPSPGATPQVDLPFVLGPIPTYLLADKVHVMAFCPSYRWASANGPQTIASRTNARTYVKGISETYQLVPQDASSWEWRRICVSVKGLLSLSPDTLQLIGAQFTAGNTTYRYFKDLTGDTSGAYITLWERIQSWLFIGTKGTDWNDQMTAKLDRARFNVHSDVMRRISSHNDSSSPRTVKTYVPINKTIQYDDEENGISMSTLPYSTQNKIGLGDIYIFDLFSVRAPINGTSSQLQVRSSMTYYWHEK